MCPSTARAKDRRALPGARFRVRVSTGAARRSPEAEARIAEIIAGILGVGVRGSHRLFFALGGDSIMSIQLSTVLRGAGYELSPATFSSTVPCALAAHKALDGRGAARGIARRGIGEPTSRRRSAGCWKLSPQPGAFDDYNQSTVLNLPAGFSDERRGGARRCYAAESRAPDAVGTTGANRRAVVDECR